NLDISSSVLRKIAQRIAGSGRNSIDVRKGDRLIHKEIQHSCGIDPAESADLQYYSSLIQTMHFLSVHTRAFLTKLFPLLVSQEGHSNGLRAGIDGDCRANAENTYRSIAGNILTRLGKFIAHLGIAGNQ